MSGATETNVCFSCVSSTTRHTLLKATNFSVTFTAMITKFGIALVFLSSFKCFASESKNGNSYPSQHFRAYIICNEMVLHTPHALDGGNKSYCNASFDGTGCWKATPVNTVATIPCPSYISGSKTERNSTRKCLANATWELNSDTGKNEGDYSECDFNGDVKSLSENQLLALMDIMETLDTSPYADLNTAHAFEKCIDDVLVQPKPVEGLYCSRTFDGWGCWNDTLASHQSHIPCPNFIPGFSHDKWAYKVCTENGTWYRHYQTNKTWSNYTTCVDLDDYAFRQKIINIHIYGYSFSVIALLLSLAIFFSFKSLSSQTRIRIHKNLFVSFIINNTMWIIWYVTIVNKYDILDRNGFDCQSLHILVHYFMVCNYFWMFCEGLYLHTLLVIAFVSERKILKWFYILGWIVPIPLTAIYAFLRHSSHDPNDTQFCWIYDSTYSLLLSGPVCLSLLLNLIFLINIVRVLITKLRAVNSPDTHQTRKAVRATLILIPLLGLHYILIPFRPEAKSFGEFVYEVISAIATSLQGLCVAMLFCFFNGEVITAIRTFIAQQMLMRSKHPTKFRSRSFQTTIV